VDEATPLTLRCQLPTTTTVAAGVPLYLNYRAGA